MCLRCIVNDDSNHTKGRNIYTRLLIFCFFISQIFKEREEDLKRLSRPLECVCFRTSIWDETLYKVRTASSPYLASPLPLENKGMGKASS